MDHLYSFVVLAFVAEVLGTIGGFGSSLFFVPIAAYFLDYHSVLGITALFHVSSNLTKIALFRHGFDKNIILWVGIPAVAFVVLGAYLSQFVNTALLEKILGVFLIVISVFFFFQSKPKSRTLPQKRPFRGHFLRTSRWTFGHRRSHPRINPILLSIANRSIHCYIGHH